MTQQAQVSITNDRRKAIITGGGILDFTNSAQFHNGLKEASLNADAVIVDLQAVEFIDTAIVQDLAKAAVTLLKRDIRLQVIVTESGYPLKVLKVSGFGSIMDIEIEGTKE